MIEMLTTPSGNENTYLRKYENHCNCDLSVFKPIRFVIHGE